jgi:hypothetical protein
MSTKLSLFYKTFLLKLETRNIISVLDHSVSAEVSSKEATRGGE